MRPNISLSRQEELEETRKLKSLACVLDKVIDPLVAKYNLYDLYWIVEELQMEIGCIEEEEEMKQMENQQVTAESAAQGGE